MENTSCVAPLNNIHFQSRAHEILERHAKSFKWAARLFNRQTAADVAILYAFCRSIDDIADNQTAETARHELAGIRSALEASFSCLPEVQAFIELAQRYRIGIRLPLLFVEAIQSDTGRVRIATRQGLIRFSYGVASTVGLMMCSVMGVRNPAAMPFAVDLGIAMQLTNIARDVVEDARRDRVYLPAEWLGDDFEPHQIIAGDLNTRRRIAGARKKLLGHAADYYRSADKACALSRRAHGWRC
jgi:phytoene synthase